MTSLDDGDEVNSYRTAGGVLIVRGAYGLANHLFAPLLENRSLGYDLARSPPQVKRKTSESCKLCDRKAHEEGECADTSSSRIGATKHGFLSLQGKKCCSWVHLFEKDLVDGSGKELRPSKKKKRQ